MKHLLKTLTEAFGPSGHEDAVRDVVLKEIKPLADEIRTDALGNLIARKKPAPGAKAPKRVMLAAHMDEIGVIASHVDKNGFVRFTNIGGVFGRYTLSARVRFINGVKGVIGYDKLEGFHDAPPISKMYIDVGATSPADCPVKVGDIAVFEQAFTELGNNRIAAKSLDDRAGVAALIETLRALKSTPNDVYFVFTTQEEVGSRGAGAAAYGIAPDLAIAVDVTPTGDTPASSKMTMELGKGPCVKIRDVGMLADPRIVNWMSKTAEKAKIPYQREVLLIGSTDAQAIQTVRAGIPSGAVSIPVRYVHSASEIVDLSDMTHVVKLLTALLSKPINIGQA
ncbi:MAG: M42 family metallopeptidase [Anaerolineales bacterium]